jgi:RNA polymerase sigma-70 factor (ECF subfamily)
MDFFSGYTDDQLVELLKSGHEEAFTEVYHRYAEWLYQFAWRILQDEDECRDAVQDVFVWLWEKRENHRITSLKYYMLAAVKYKLIRAIKRSKRRGEILSSLPEAPSAYTENSIELKELKEVIRQFTECLPRRAKEVFHLSREKYLSNREIADRMNIREKTVENQMTIILKKLRHTLNHMSYWLIFFYWFSYFQ